jgi:hypothetical protein
MSKPSSPWSQLGAGFAADSRSAETINAQRIRERRFYRRLEQLPGLFIWVTFALALGLTFVRPLWAILFIIAFDLLWLIRITYVLTFVVIAFTRFRRALRVNWAEQCLQPELQERFHKLHHLVVLPTHQDSIEVVRTTLQYLTRVTVPLSSLFVVLAIEERDGEEAKTMAEKLESEFGKQFGNWLTTSHPASTPGEMAGKGSNIAWAGRQAKKRIDELQWSYDEIIVSTFDIDSCVHPQYFACLSHAFLVHPKPTRTSFQPIPLYSNNVWQAPPFTRIVANSTTFWLLSETIRTERMFTFSSHSMSFRALVDVDFWQSDIVTEDSRIFIQCLLTYDGDYSVTPIYIPISMDTVQGRTFWETVVHQYKQIRRWAYGVENFPYMVWNFRRNPKIRRSVKFRYIWNQLEGEYSWATAPILIYILGYIPLALASDSERLTALYQSAPDILRVLMTFSMIGLFASAVMSIIILPPKPQKNGFISVLGMVLQWAIFPITMVVFGSIPAIEAQTRLMTGRYLGYWPTTKFRSSTTTQVPPQ